MSEWLNQTWIIVAAIIGGVSLVWTFYSKTLKEISAALTKPFKELDAKIDNLDHKIDATIETDDIVKDALLTMQRQSILRACDEYLRQGYADMNQKATVSSQYESYHALGGDSFITDMVEKVKDLPQEKPVKHRKTKTEE